MTSLQNDTAALFVTRKQNTVPDMHRATIRRCATSLPVATADLVRVTSSTKQQQHPVCRIAAADDEITSATRLCEILRSRGLGDPTMTSSAPEVNVRRHSLPSHYSSISGLARRIERVQTIPFLVEEIRRAAADRADEARRQADGFARRVEAQCRTDRLMAELQAAAAASRRSAPVRELSPATGERLPSTEEETQ